MKELTAKLEGVLGLTTRAALFDIGDAIEVLQHELEEEIK